MNEFVEIKDTQVTFLNDQIKGVAVNSIQRVVGDLDGIFANNNAFKKADHGKIAYEVDSFLPEEDGTEGGLFFGITRLFPGKIGNEYHMTKGHFHTKSNRAEFYWGIEGDGVLLLMDRDRNITVQKVYKGSLNYVPSHTAHRMVNTGTKILSFGACWPSDAGHDYESIAKNGFAAIVIEIDGKVLVKKTK